MASIEITRTELVWPGKYDDQGNRVAPERVNLPFQVIETINQSRATREAGKQPSQTTLFDVWAGDAGETFDEGWRNKLIWGDNLLVMSSLLEQFAGKIDLIYIDPPFATGADFSVTASVGDGEDTSLTKAQSAIEEKVYRDTWADGVDSYLSMMAARIALMRELLSPQGSLLIHCDWHVGHALKVVADEILGPGAFLNEIVWTYKRWTTRVSVLPRLHDTIFWYRRSDKHVFHQPMIVNTEPNPSQYVSGKDASGKTVVMRDDAGRPIKREIRDEIPVADYWDIPLMSPVSPERVAFPTQKPERLLGRIIEMASNPGDLVADFFAGSGTTVAVAEKLGRRWIAADLGRYAIHTTRKRLMGIEGCKPFDVLNLGKYERQYWQRASFGDPHTQDRVVFEYLAFILRLYGAEPISGTQHLHGKKSGAVVHIGAVDAPVTIAEVESALQETVATGQGELHVLGWEWEMGLNDLVNQLAQQRHVRLKLLAIPREVMEIQAVDRGDIRFFELAHLDAAFVTDAKRGLGVELTDFAMSDADAIPEDVRDKVTKWSDYVDYWAIDWDFRNDTFMNGWVAYRTRRERKLPLESDRHTYPQPGNYAVAVKVVDIFGNDTTRVFPVEVGA